MKLKRPLKIDPMPLGLFGGASEFEAHFPAETMRLGALTAYWSLVEDALCRVFGALLGNFDKAEAAFYSTVNHKARRDMVSAVASRSQLDNRARTYVKAGLETAKEAADARNHLLHGLFSADFYSGELLSIVKRPLNKVPEFTKKGIMKELDAAIAKCELAVGVLQSTTLAILHPDVLDEAEARKK